jgi:hypothetical protein
MPRCGTVRYLPQLEQQRRRRSMILKMSRSWRTGLWLLLLVVAVTLLWVWITSLRRPKTPTPIIDLGTTMPLNQPGGGLVPSEAYELYSALYQAPMQEPLVFSEDSLTDIPRVNGSCLRPAAAQEREMTDAFVAANQQSHRVGAEVFYTAGISAAATQRACPGADVRGDTRARCCILRELQANQICAVAGSTGI